MQNEIDLLLNEADIERTDTIGGVDYYVGKLCDRDVVIVKSGIGKVLSASGAPGEEREEGQDGYYPCDERLVDLAYNSAVKVVGEDHQIGHVASQSNVSYFQSAMVSVTIGLSCLTFADN